MALPFNKIGDILQRTVVVSLMGITVWGGVNLYTVSSKVIANYLDEKKKASEVDSVLNGD